MNMNDYNNCIFFVKESAKESLIKKINRENKLLNIKVYTLEELKKKFFFDYGNEAIYQVSKEFNMISEIARIVIDNIYYIKDINNEKVEFLKRVKEFLDEKKLLKYNPLFKESLKGKKIILYDLEYVDNFYKNIFSIIKSTSEVVSLNNKVNNGKKKLYRAKDKNEEVAFVCESICKLIKSGVDINKIKLANVTSDYEYTIKKVFREFRIPINLENKNEIGGTKIVSVFKKNYSSNIKDAISAIKDLVKSKRDKKVYDKIIEVINSYAWCSDYDLVKDMLISDISKISVNSEKYKNAVDIIDFENDIISEDNYVFLIGFNQGVIPALYKDEDYLSDKIKLELGISDSCSLNVNATNNLIDKIKSTKNLIVTYRECDDKGELYISSAYRDNLFESEKLRIDYSSSNSYNKTRLLSMRDEFMKFGTASKDFGKLSHHYQDEPYKNYDNSFKGVDAGKIYEYIGSKLNLSYSSMNTYYNCAFKYYLDNVFRLNEFENNFDAALGNIFHECLSKCFNDDFDLNTEYVNAIEKIHDYEFTSRDKFYLNILKSELEKIINIVKGQLDYTLLKKALSEKEVKIPLDESKNIYFKGFIDKIMYDEFDNEKIAVIIDYKTGSADIDISWVNFGLKMQLPVYVYLLRNTEEFKNATIGGFYLERILSNNLDEKVREDELKWYGYSNSKLDVLSKVDVTYANSSLIKSLKMGENGFYRYAKVLSDGEIDNLVKLVDDKIKFACNEILNGNYNINPKEVNGDLVGCKFCKYKSICYRKNADIVKLRTERTGDTNAEVD